MSTAHRPTATATFARRASTNVPPAAHAFEPLVRSVLGHRLVHTLFVFSAAFSLASTVCLARGGDASFVWRLFRLRTCVDAALTWSVGVLPILVVRKVFMAPTPAPAYSPSATMAAAFAKPTTRRWMSVYITSALLLLSLKCARTWSHSEDMRLSVFVKSRKHPYYLNGRLIFLVLAQVWLSVSFALRNIMLERLVFRWAKTQPSANAPYAPRNLGVLLVTITLFTLSSFAVYNVAFGIARLVLLPALLRVPIIRSLLKPFVGHFVRGPWTLTLPLRHASLESHAFMLGVLTLTNWEFAETLFDVYIPQPVKVASNTADANMTLVSGITSTHPLYLHFAYAELRDMAVESHASGPARRTALFSDQKFSPSLWSTLVRGSLLQLGRDYQTLLRRGAPPPADAPPPATAPKAAHPPATPLLRKAIYKPPGQSPLSKVLDTLASDSDDAKAADAVASEVGARVVDSAIPALFCSTSSLPVAAAAAPPATAVTSPSQPNVMRAHVSRAGAACRQLVAAHAPSWCRHAADEWGTWWRRERIHKMAEHCLPNRDVDALVIEVLAGLVCASLAEDRYGVVQRDMPRILEAFVSFLAALEAYQVEVTTRYVPPTPDEITRGDGGVLREKERTRVEVAKATEAIGIVADALRSGVADVVRTFGDKLVAFRFAPGTAEKLQAFVDYA